MKKLFLFLTLLFVGMSVNAQYTPSNNLNYVKLIKTPPAGTTTDQMLVYDGADQFVKMRPVDTDNREAVNDVNKTITGTANRLIAYTAITADRTVTLPPATTANQRIWITDESGLCSNARRIIVIPSGADVIGGDAFSVINFPNGSGYLESNGAGKWNIISTTAVQFSAGVNTLPTITDNGNGSVTLGTGVYSLFANANGVGRPKAYQIAGGTFTFVDGSTNYIYADYNTTTGAVTLQQTTTETPLNDLTQTLVYAAYRQGTTLHPRNFDTQGIALSNKINRSIYRTQRVRFEEGGILVGESASPAVRTITISSGTVWVGATEQVLSALTSAANTCYHVIQTSPGVWTTTTVVTQYNNTQYNTSSGLQTLNNNEYGVNWLYRSIGTDNNMAIILGGASYTLGQAQSSQKPTNLPPFMRHMELVGRIIVLKNATTATQIDNVSSTFFTASGVTDHNALNNLQTAQTGVTYGHITDGAQTIAGVKTFSSSPIVPTPTTGLQTANKNYVDSITSSGVSNVSTVTGATVTVALDNLNVGKANDSNVIHTTGNEAKTGNLNIVGIVGVNTIVPVGKMTIFTGLTGADTNVIGQQNGSISFSNSAGLTASPTIVGKSNDAPGLLDISVTNNTNATYDRLFEVRENDDSDFSTLTTGGFSFRRYATEIFRILRNGNSTLSGSLKANNFTTDLGDYLVGTKTKSAIASFYNNTTITAHADYGFLENSDLNYASAAFQGHASFNDNINIIGIQDSDHHHSFQSYPHYSNTGLLTSMSGFWMQPDITAGSVTDVFQFKANNPLGAGVITNLYGLYVSNLNRATNNYAIYTAGTTQSYFGGSTHFNNKIDVASDAYFLTKVGIGGTITPTANLEVIDTNKTNATAGNSTIRSTDTAAIDKGGYLTLGGSYSGTLRTSFAGIAGRKENSTNGNIAGYLSFTTSDDTLGITEKMRIFSNGGVSIGNITNPGASNLSVTGSVTMGNVLKLKAYTVSTLPGGSQGDMAYVTDATAPTYNGTLTGGGSVVIPVFFDGTAWRAH